MNDVKYLIEAVQSLLSARNSVESVTNERVTHWRTEINIMMDEMLEVAYLTVKDERDRSH